MKSFKRIFNLSFALLVCVLFVGCSKSDVNENSGVSTEANSASTSQTTTQATTQVTTQNVPELLEELKAENAEVFKFIQLAKDSVETADSDTVKLLTQAIFEAQKEYPTKVAADYETANASSDFATLFSVDITDDLIAKIQDESIRKTVDDSIANGFMLTKMEGYIFPIIDIGVYEPFFSYMTEADQASLKADITAFNQTL